MSLFCGAPAVYGGDGRERTACEGAAGQFSGGPGSYDNPAVVNINTEPAHAFMRPSASESEALQFQSLSSRMQSLNGEWDFKMVLGKSSVPDCFFVDQFDTSDWGRISVPSNWQREGYGLPVFSNSTLDTEPDEVGLYRTTFTVPQAWQEGRVMIRMEGVKTAYHLYLNGREVGYAEGAYLPSEFDITDKLREGSNQLAIAVYRTIDVQELENFDTWRLSGIFRDVSLLYRPDIYIEDFEIGARAVNQFVDGEWRVSATLRNKSSDKVAANTLQLEADLRDKQTGQLVRRLVQPVPAIEPGATANVDFSAPVKNARLWSAEQPNLYTTSLILKAADRDLEAVAARTGFRSLTIEDGQIKLNGKKIYFKGVNRHEWHPDMARAITPQVALDDLKFMKVHNINAIRTSHYPNDSTFYEMADEMGFYVMDEAAMETHWATHAEKKEGWGEAHLSRIEGMIERDKNHPSVLLWSVGNEFYPGPHTDAMYDYAVQRDPSRFTYYDAKPSPEKSPVRESAYNNLQIAVQNAKKDPRPVIMKEYFHASGNGMGLFKQLWDVIRDPAYKNLHGGFIWDFKDQGWRINSADGSYMDWGRDAGFAATGNDGLDGITDALLTPNAKTAEVARVFQDIAVTPAEKDSTAFVIHNRHSFTDLDQFYGRYTLQVDGVDRYTSLLPDLQAAAGESRIVRIDESAVREAKRNGGDVRILFEFYGKQQTEAGRTAPVAWEQLPVQEGSDPSFDAPGAARISVEQGSGSVKVEANGVHYHLNGKLGRLLSWRLGEAELLDRARGPVLNLWRAPIDGDVSEWGGLQARYLSPWLGLGLDRYEFRKAKMLLVQSDDKQVVVDVTVCLQVTEECIADVAYRYTFLADGSLALGVNLKPRKAMKRLAGLPRLGVTMNLQSQFDRVRWFGLGPHENYRDRQAGAVKGLFNSSPEKLYEAYIPVQANGNRSGVDWLEVKSASGVGLNISRLSDRAMGSAYASYLPGGKGFGNSEAGQFEFTAIPYTEAELEQADHTKDLPAVTKTVLSLDAEHAGVASHPRPARLPEHEVQAKDSSFLFLFRPVGR